MKKALPANAKISKEAKETVQECVSEFISFITGEASDKCLREKRKTINGDDLLWAMSTLGFDDYIDPLKLYLHKFRELEGDKQGIGTGAPGGGGSASSSSSQPTDVLGGGGNVGGSYGAGLYGTGAGGAGSGGSGMMVMGQQLYGGSPTSGSLYQHQHQQHQLGSGLFRGNSGSGSGGGSGGSSSPSGRQGRI